MSDVCASGRCTNKPKNGGHGYCRKHAQLHGYLQPRVPAEKALAELDRLTAKGATHNAICVALGWKSSMLTRLTTGRCKTVSRHMYDSLRTLHVDDVEVFEAWPYQRRLRSLRAAGLSAEALADEIGIDVTYLTQMCIAPPTARINRRTREGIEAAWQRHQHDPVSATSPQVEKRKWVPPMWWDDIDDPDEQPGVTHCTVCHGPDPRPKAGTCHGCGVRMASRRKRQKAKEARAA